MCPPTIHLAKNESVWQNFAEMHKVVCANFGLNAQGVGYSLIFVIEVLKNKKICGQKNIFFKNLSSLGGDRDAFDIHIVLKASSVSIVLELQA